MVLADPALIGSTRAVWLLADDDVDMLIKGHIEREVPEDERRIKDNQLAWIDKLSELGQIEKRFNTTFFTAGDSREPELAGIRVALMGSLYVGYDASFLGGIVGALWAFVDGAIAGALIALIYNAVARTQKAA